MSVKVSRIDDSTTSWKKGDKLMDHYHRLDYSSIEVPSIEEHRTLEDKVKDCQRDIDKVDSRLRKGEQRLSQLVEAIPALSTEVKDVRCRLENTARALNETGQLATAFKSVTDKHLGNIQKVVDSLSVKIKDGERELKAKANDGLEQIKRTASEVAAKIHEAEQTVSAGVKKSSEAVTEFGKIREQAVSALKNTAAIVQKQLSEFVAEKTAKIDAVEQSVQRSAFSIKESVGKIAALQAAADKLEERLHLIEKEDTLGKLASIEQKYRETLEACQDTLSAANYFRSVNRSFFSRLWWCLTGNCKEEVSDDQTGSTETEDNS